MEGNTWSSSRHFLIKPCCTLHTAGALFIHHCRLTFTVRNVLHVSFYIIGQIFFSFLQFSGKICQIIGWPLFGGWCPNLRNPGSATVHLRDFCGINDMKAPQRCHSILLLKWNRNLVEFEKESTPTMPVNTSTAKLRCWPGSAGVAPEIKLKYLSDSYCEYQEDWWKWKENSCERVKKSFNTSSCRST